MRAHGYDDLIVTKRMRSYTMRLFFCSTDVGCFEFLFTTDEQRATELLGIYIVLAKMNPSKLAILAAHALVWAFWYWPMMGGVGSSRCGSG